MTTAGEHPFNNGLNNDLGRGLGHGFGHQGHQTAASPSTRESGADPSDAMETYFSCITTCSLDDGSCITQCVEEFRQHH